jgi:hypothetical protein
LAGGFWDLRDEDDLTWVARWLDLKFEQSSPAAASIILSSTLCAWLSGTILGLILAHALRWALAALSLSGDATLLLAFVFLLLPLVCVVPHVALLAKLKNETAATLCTVPLLVFVFGASDVSRMAAALPSPAGSHLTNLITGLSVTGALAFVLFYVRTWRRRRKTHG